MSSNSNGNGITIPDPTPVGQATAAAHPSAMTLFAPDPNADPESVSCLIGQAFMDGCLMYCLIEYYG
jgi:hypothetical protein